MCAFVAAVLLGLVLGLILMAMTILAVTPQL